MLTKEQAEIVLSTLSEGDKAKLYDSGCTLYYTSRYNTEKPWLIQTWGDCYASEIGRYETYEEALAAIETLGPDFQPRVW